MINPIFVKENINQISKHIDIVEVVDDEETGERTVWVNGTCDEQCEKFLKRWLKADRIKRVGEGNPLPNEGILLQT